MDVRRVIPRDAIPSVDEPRFGPPDGAGLGDDAEVVVVVPSALGAAGSPRAYPLRYLHYHEIVNDVLDGRPHDGGDGHGDGRPIAVTWCPLCGSAVVYDRTVDGRLLEFGVSGKLADDDLVLYDRETDTEWKQSSGEAIDGPLAGRRLDALPGSVLPLGRFREDYDGVVLRPPGGASEAAGPGEEPTPIDYDADPYERYFSIEGFGLGAHRGGDGRDWDHPLDPKAVVLGVVIDDDALAFPAGRVERAGGLAGATVGGERVLVLQAAGLHAYRDPGFELEAVGEGRFAGGGTVWDGATGRSDDGRRLDRLPTRRLFAMAWADDHGPGAFWAADGD